MFDWLEMMRARNYQPMESKVYKDWKYKGLHCRVIQGPFSINGYVAVPKGHPDYAKGYDDVDVEIHGGLTFAEKGEKDSELWPNEETWWFGFDTAHAHSGVWSIEQVIEETERLAKQLVERIK